MKSPLCFSFLFIICPSLYAQPGMPAELATDIARVSTFHELQQTVNSYYRDQLTRSVDSAVLKQHQRKLKHWNRYFWWNEHFLDINGRIVDYNQRVLEARALQRREPVTNARYQAAMWEEDGPTYNVNNGAEGMGRIDVIAFHPSDPAILFAGANNGGIFKSTNGGASWFSLTEYLPSLGVAGICIHPANPNVMYVLSGNRNGGGFISQYRYTPASTGVYKSTNGGDTWHKMPDLPFTDFTSRDMIMDAANPSTLLVATSEGICKTTNGGNSWSIVHLGDNIWELDYKPGSSTRVYAVGDDAFFLSVNGGDDFDEVNVAGIASASRISIAVTPDNDDLIMLLAGSTASEGMIGVFKSTDSGESWELVYDDQDADLFHNYIGEDNVSGQVTYNNTIAIHPLNDAIILAGGLCIWRSDDGGVTWEQETAYWPGADFVHPDQHLLIFNEAGHVYVGNDGGVYGSFDTGLTWQFAEQGLTTTQFYHFEVDNDEGDTWGGTQDNGVLEREGNGGGFFMYAFGDGYDVMTDHPWQVDDGESDDVYYTVNTGIYSDNGDISVPGNEVYFGNLGMDPTDEDHIYVGYDNVYESFDAGEDWELLSEVSGKWGLATCKSNADRLYVAGPSGNFSSLFRLDDGVETALTDSLIEAGFVNGFKITDIEVSPTNSNVVYISSSGFSADSKVFSSSNGGVTWNNWSFNLPNVPVFSLLRDPAGGLYAGTYLGVYYKRSGIDYWEPYYNGLPPVPVTEMELYNYSNGVPQSILISTFGRGLWKTLTYDADCPNSIILSGDVQGLYYGNADTQIQSSHAILASEGTVVRYNAGTEIRLIPGFHAKGPGTFKTYLSGCGALIDPD